MSTFRSCGRRIEIAAFQRHLAQGLITDDQLARIDAREAQHAPTSEPEQLF